MFYNLSVAEDPWADLEAVKSEHIHHSTGFCE